MWYVSNFVIELSRIYAGITRYIYIELLYKILLNVLFSLVKQWGKMLHPLFV